MLNREYPIKEYQFPLFRYTQQKSPLSYSKELVKNVAMISFYPEGAPKEMAQIFGSFMYAIQKYPGDVDLLQKFNGCCSEEEVINQFIHELQRIVRNIVGTKEHYMSEFKAGIDYDYDFDIGPIHNGKWIPSQELKHRIIFMYDRKLFDNEEASTMLYILDKKMFNGNGYDIVYNIFRNRRLLRWSAKEILAGFKITNGKKFTLSFAIKAKSYVKIDMVCIYNNRFIEMTNIVDLYYHDEDNEEYYPINDPAHPDNDDIPYKLSFEVEKLYYSDYYYSSFKCVKRIFAISRMTKDGQLLNLIIPLIEGNISLLYQMKSELDVIEIIYERAVSIPIGTIKKQIDQMKNRISTVIEVSDETKNNWYFRINQILNLDLSRDEQVEILSNINKEMKKIINFYTITYLSKVHLNPIPEYYNFANVHDYSTRLLPPRDEIKYGFIIRKPTDNPNVKQLIPKNLRISDFIKEESISSEESKSINSEESESISSEELSEQSEPEYIHFEKEESSFSYSFEEPEQLGSEEEIKSHRQKNKHNKEKNKSNKESSEDNESTHDEIASISEEIENANVLSSSEEGNNIEIQSEESEEDVAADRYCGAKAVPKGKIRGSPEYCAKTNQIRYYGLVKIDEKLLTDTKGKGPDITKKRLALRKAEDEAKILIQDIGKVRLIIDKKRKAKKKHKNDDKKLDSLLIKKDKIIRKLKSAKEALKKANKNEKEKNKRANKVK